MRGDVESLRPSFLVFFVLGFSLVGLATDDAAQRYVPSIMLSDSSASSQNAGVGRPLPDMTGFKRRFAQIKPGNSTADSYRVGGEAAKPQERGVPRWECAVVE